jgi:hypothetical protein
MERDSNKDAERIQKLCLANNWGRNTIDEVADEAIKAMGLNNVKKIYKPVLHEVGWPGDVKKIA